MIRRRKLRFHRMLRIGRPGSSLPRRQRYFFAGPMSCGTENDQEWKKRRRKGVFFALTLLVLWLVFFCVSFIDHRLKPIVQDMASLTVHQKAAEIIYTTMYEEILPEVDYQQLIYFHQDENSQLIYLNVDSGRLGQLVTSSAAAIKQRLYDLEQQTLEIPLGQVTGLYLLANRGPKLQVTIKPVGVVDVQIGDSFQQAGINQVKHTIYMDIQTDIQVLVPFMTHTEEVGLKLTVADSVIVGKVPEVYLAPGNGLFSSLAQ